MGGCHRAYGSFIIKILLQKQMRSYLTVLWLICIISVQGQLYDYDSLELNYELRGKVIPTETGSAPRLQNIDLNIFLYPEEDYRQKILSWKSPAPKAYPVHFSWDGNKIEAVEYGYQAQVQTNNKRPEVHTKIPFPIRNGLPGYESYLAPTETIDSDTPEIRSIAADLAEGEDDLFVVSFKVAVWVEEHIQYDLNTLTATASQKASWVLEHRQGVCDEMTSLFVAMMRSLGVPARFVSGISYTTSPEFSDPWQPHGWAEVYFPEVGWVPFDITFGEYGYIDVTHIKLRDGFDPAEPATKVQWLGNDIDLSLSDLQNTVSIAETGSLLPPEISIEMELLSDNLGFGSYTVVKGILKNNKDYYVAKTIQISIPEEVTLAGKKSRKILLAPKEVREISWIVQVPADLRSDTIYTIPVVLATETNTTVQDSFTIQKEGPQYGLGDLDHIVEEEKAYSRKIVFSCEYPKEMQRGEKATFICTIKNTGDTLLQGLEFCLNQICDVVDLPIQGQHTNSIRITAEKGGWRKIFVEAKNAVAEKKITLEYAVKDEPQIEMEIAMPQEISLGKEFGAVITLRKSSFSLPQRVVLELEGLGMQQQWQLEQLREEETLHLQLDGNRLGFYSVIKANLRWGEPGGKAFHQERELLVQGKASSLGGKIKLFWNDFVELFY